VTIMGNIERQLRALDRQVPLRCQRQYRNAPPPSLTTYWKARYPHYHLSPHIALMIEELEALQPGEGLIITMPPRHSKTETVKAWLEWQLG